MFALTLVGCNSNENKAQKLIEDYLSKNLNDASSYESIEFSELDSTFSNFYFSQEGKELAEKQDFAHYYRFCFARKSNSVKTENL